MFHLLVSCVLVCSVFLWIVTGSFSYSFSSCTMQPQSMVLWYGEIIFVLFFRYINHSCAPNCVAEVVTFERGYKIIISSVRRIEKGEEVRHLLLDCSMYTRHFMY